MSKNNSLYGRVNILRILSKDDAHVHFIGASGAGMSSLLLLSSHFGISVSGEDKAECECISALRSVGDITIGAHKKIPESTTLLVYTLAIDDDHEAIKEAEERGIPAVSRAEYMSALVEPFLTKLAVAGTHGKSTTTAMLGAILRDAGLVPTTICGAPVTADGRGVEIGALDYLVYEACEYKNSFLYFEPTFSLFLNLEYDHPDFFDSIGTLKDSFLLAMRRARRAVVCIDDGNLLEIARKLDTPPILFGSSDKAHYYYERVEGQGLTFRVFHLGEYACEVKLSLIGEFNILNALGALALSHELGIPFDKISASLSRFAGIPRRLEKIGVFDNRRVYYDYAHHPTEIRAGIKGIKSHTGRELTLIFAPHTYSRTKALWCEFVEAISGADYKIITEISAIRESKIEGVCGKRLASSAGACFCQSPRELILALSRTKGDIVIMGAADTSWVKRALKL